MVKHTIGLRAALLVLAALAILPAGCGKPQQPLRVGLLVWPAYELVEAAPD